MEDGGYKAVPFVLKERRIKMKLQEKQSQIFYVFFFQVVVPFTFYALAFSRLPQRHAYKSKAPEPPRLKDVVELNLSSRKHTILKFLEIFYF